MVRCTRAGAGGRFAYACADATRPPRRRATPPAGDAEGWRSGGGGSYCDNIDFPQRLAERWLEILGADGELALTCTPAWRLHPRFLLPPR